MNTPPVDPSLALQEATTNSELVKRKMEMDALRKRLGDTSTRQEKLRESCEGFEAIFLQKMWEQMRKTVPKEGYLHSKDEEMYQSLFDIELCKKMAGAGGIGLANMLYAQLAQQLENTGRTTVPSRSLLQVPPSEALSPLHSTGRNITEPLAASSPDKAAVAAKDLYSPLPEPEAEAAQQSNAADAVRISSVDAALNDLKNGLPPLQEDTAGAAVADWAANRAAMTGMDRIPLLEAMPDGSSRAPAQTTMLAEQVPQGAAGARSLADDPGAAMKRDFFAADDAPEINGAPASGESATVRPQAEAQPPAQPPEQAMREQAIQEQAGTAASARERASSGSVNPALLSWQGNGPVSINGKPSSALGRNRNHARGNNAAKAPAAASPSRGLAPQESVWPLEGVITERFGWEDDALTGKRRWNSGIKIAAPADSPVRAVLAGKVAYAGQREGHGYTVVLEHNGGFRSYYSNLQDTSLQVGQSVAHGANFAKVAAQPTSSPDGANSAILHFEMKKGEMALNPESAIRRMATASR